MTTCLGKKRLIRLTVRVFRERLCVCASFPFGFSGLAVGCDCISFDHCLSTVELQWLEHVWDHENMFETWVVRAKEC